MFATQTQSFSNTRSEDDPRPRFAIGHISLSAGDVSSLADFYERLGMRSVVNMGRMAILELRGGTHIVIHKGAAGVSTLDLIVDDIDDVHQAFVDAETSPTRIERGHPHDRFDVRDPEGNEVVVSSNHAMGMV